MIKLRHYQEKALNHVKYLSSFGLFMGTGTGKTITSLYRASENPTNNLLIVCPHSVKEQWKDTIETYFPKFKVLPFSMHDKAKTKQEIIHKNKDFNTIIVNYEIIHKLNLDTIINDDWTIIVDESHRIKSTKTIVAQEMLKISKNANYKIILTATPTQGDFGGYIDYYTQLSFLGYIDYTDKLFKSRYINFEVKQFKGSPYPIKIIKSYKNTDELDNLLQACCVRYVPNFGDYEPEHIKIKLPKPKNYNKVSIDKVYKEILMKNIARKRIGLKTICTGNMYGLDAYGDKHTYIDNTIKIDWLKEFLEDTDEVIAIYYNYNVELDILEQLMKKLKKTYVVINGNTKDKYGEINKKTYDVLLGQYQSASEGLDGLQHKCHIQVLFAMPESSLLYKQVIGRIDRDGQTKVPIYYYLTCEDTIEEKIYAMIQSKVEFSEITLDKLLLKEE